MFTLQRGESYCSLEVFSKEQITQIYNSTFKSIKIINNTNYTYTLIIRRHASLLSSTTIYVNDTNYT